MERLNNYFIRWSRRWWPLFVAALGSALSFQSLLVIGERFAAVTNGYRPFDLQNPIARGDILAQLPMYTANSRNLYWIFIVADTIFPVLAALPLVLLLAKALNAINQPWSTQALGRGFALTPLVLAVLDWIENAFFVATVALFPQDITAWATLAVATKATKITLLVACNAAILGLVVYALIRWFARSRRHKLESSTTGQ